jgi:hypothetical protein
MDIGRSGHLGFHHTFLRIHILVSCVITQPNLISLQEKTLRKRGSFFIQLHPTTIFTEHAIFILYEVALFID